MIEWLIATTDGDTHLLTYDFITKFKLYVGTTDEVTHAISSVAEALRNLRSRDLIINEVIQISGGNSWPITISRPAQAF